MGAPNNCPLDPSLPPRPLVIAVIKICLTREKSECSYYIRHKYFSLCTGDPEAVQSSGTLKTISSLQGDVQNLDNAKRDGWVIELPLRSVTGGGWASWYMLL